MEKLTKVASTCPLAPPTDTKMVATEWKNLVFVPSRASNQTGSFERRPPRSWSHLLDVDPVQRPHLLGRRGGFGFVVSVSLTTKTQSVDSPSSCFKKLKMSFLSEWAGASPVLQTLAKGPSWLCCRLLQWWRCFSCRKSREQILWKEELDVGCSSDYYPQTFKGDSGCSVSKRIRQECV